MADVKVVVRAAVTATAEEETAVSMAPPSATTLSSDSANSVTEKDDEPRSKITSFSQIM
jgi:hypothetical protein